jgi:hypothetical protein
MSINFHALSTASLPLNLNPGPPRENANQWLAPGAEVSINPQPLPPGIASTRFLAPGSTVSLNPQPLPPKEMLLSSYLNPGLLVSLNPQPLPPGPPDPEANLWDNSAVLTSRGSDSMHWFHDNLPDPQPILNGAFLG